MHTYIYIWDELHRRQMHRKKLWRGREVIYLTKATRACLRRNSGSATCWSGCTCWTRTSQTNTVQHFGVWRPWARPRSVHRKSFDYLLLWLRPRQSLALTEAAGLGSERHHCVWTTASRSWSRSHGRLKTMMRCNLRSTPSFIMMRLSVIQKSCVLVAGFSYNRKRVTSLNKNWKLLIIDAWRQKNRPPPALALSARCARSETSRRRRVPLLRSRTEERPLFLRDDYMYSTLDGTVRVVRRVVASLASSRLSS